MRVNPSLDLGKPLILLADVVPFAKVDEIGDRLSGEEVEGVDELNLNDGLATGSCQDGREVIEGSDQDFIS